MALALRRISPIVRSKGKSRSAEAVSLSEIGSMVPQEVISSRRGIKRSRSDAFGTLPYARIQKKRSARRYRSRSALSAAAEEALSRYGNWQAYALARNPPPKKSICKKGETCKKGNVRKTYNVSPAALAARSRQRCNVGTMCNSKRTPYLRAPNLTYRGVERFNWPLSYKWMRR